jgi:hypothetical protein
MSNNLNYPGRMLNNYNNFNMNQSINQLNANLEYLQQMKQFQMNLNPLPNRGNNFMENNSMDFNFQNNNNNNNTNNQN